MAEVSRNLVAILLILVIVISGLGTWSLFTAHRETTSASAQQPASDGSGLVALSIMKASQDKATVSLLVPSGAANHG